ncbi:MAG: 50S ribosomal protein L23 [Nanoarchaeota archaeon]|nr:50S ribosomal protein L23 [Nanoarchaeota archaeon]
MTLILKPITTEKAIRIIEIENVLTFETDRNLKKPEIKKQIEEIFNIKIEKIRTQTKKNKKIVYAKLNKKNPAIDIATKLGMM